MEFVPLTFRYTFFFRNPIKNGIGFYQNCLRPIIDPVPLTAFKLRVCFILQLDRNGYFSAETAIDHVDRRRSALRKNRLVSALPEFCVAHLGTSPLLDVKSARIWCHESYSSRSSHGRQLDTWINGQAPKAW